MINSVDYGSFDLNMITSLTSIVNFHMIINFYD